jgi:hypothetical protein
MTQTGFELPQAFDPRGSSVGAGFIPARKGLNVD